MTEAPSEDRASKHIFQLSFDMMLYSNHRECDIQIRELLQDPANQHLRNPHSRSNYFGLVKLIIENYDVINDREDSHFKTIKAKYTGDNVSDEVYKDFKRMIDTCLVYGRFRDIRLLHDFYAHDNFFKHFVAPVRWNDIARYLFSENREVDWKENPKAETL